MPNADSPISTNDDKRLYFNTISDLAYIDNGHGKKLTDYPNHFIMVFYLTSTQQASHNFIHPELTNCSISIELKFSAALPNNIEIYSRRPASFGSSKRLQEHSKLSLTKVKTYLDT